MICNRKLHVPVHVRFVICRVQIVFYADTVVGSRIIFAIDEIRHAVMFQDQAPLRIEVRSHFFYIFNFILADLITFKHGGKLAQFAKRVRKVIA